MRLHRLNAPGVERFSTFLDSLTSDSPEPYPQSILEAPNYSEPVQPSSEVEYRSFANRFQLASYFHQLLTETRLPDVESDRGLWAWLSVLYFEQLCPLRVNGRRRPGERVRWIPVLGDFRRYYQHLVAGPYRVFKAHRDDPERTRALLCGPPHEVSDVYLELAKRQELVTNPAVVAAATRLYYDPTKERLKRSGARGAPGTIRRFAEVLVQLDVVWDLYSMSADELIEMLPAEFQRFRD